MGKVITLDDEIRQTAQDALDDLLQSKENGGLAKRCILVYPPKWVACVNCVPGPGGVSSNRWVTGGPIPFQDGSLCPLCDGNGKRADEVTDEVYLQIASEPAHFFIRIPVHVQVPAGTIQAKGFVWDLPKVLQAQQLIVQPNELPVTYRYVMDGEPLFPGNIIQGRYWYAFFKRAG